VNIFKNIIDKVVDAFSSSKEFKINDYDETNYDDKIVPYNEILESKNGILIAILSKIAKSDGVISVNESNYISKQIDSFQIKEEIRHIYSKEIINQEKDNTSNIEELCKKFLVSNKNESKIFIKNLVDITKVDNKFDKNQYKMLSDIMTFINLPEDNIKEFQIELLEKPNEECKKLYQKLYILKLEKEDIKGKIEEIEYKAFKNYGEIKLELLSLKKDLSKEFLEEYNNYLEFYNKYKNQAKVKLYCFSSLILVSLLYKILFR
jgi:DnaJ like chaperone protein